MTALQLKEYQRESLEAIGRFSDAVRDAVAKKALRPVHDAYYSQTRRDFIEVPQLPNVPYVCLRVPTGGGKTLIAAHAVGAIARRLGFQDRPLCLWVTPSTTIRDQTLRGLRDRAHPYHAALRDGLGVPVEVLTVEEALSASRAMRSSPISAAKFWSDKMSHENGLEIETLALVLQASLYASRRAAKRVLHEHGMIHASAADLDAVLGAIKAHPRHAQIHAQAEAMQAASMEGARLRAQAARSTPDQKDDLPPWLIGETPAWGRTFITHHCPGGSQSFVGEVFDEESQVPPGLERHPLDGGQVLANITWMDGDVPPPANVAALMAEARKQLRIYDQGIKK